MITTTSIYSGIIFYISDNGLLMEYFYVIQYNGIWKKINDSKLNEYSIACI